MLSRRGRAVRPSRGDGGSSAARRSMRVGRGSRKPEAPEAFDPRRRAARLSPAAAMVSVVIPTLNEAANLPHVLTRLPECVDEVVIVDGHSEDDTIKVAPRHPVRRSRDPPERARQGERGGLRAGRLARGVRRDAGRRRIARSGGDHGVPHGAAVRRQRCRAGLALRSRCAHLRGDATARAWRHGVLQRRGESPLRNTLHGPQPRLQRVQARRALARISVDRRRDGNWRR